MGSGRSHAAQMVGSLLVALAIAAIVIAIVTAKIGPGNGLKDDRGGKGKQEQTDSSGRGSGEG
jgi:hypothetical protein